MKYAIIYLKVVGVLLGVVTLFGVLLGCTYMVGWLLQTDHYLLAGTAVFILISVITFVPVAIRDCGSN